MNELCVQLDLKIGPTLCEVAANFSAPQSASSTIHTVQGDGQRTAIFSEVHSSDDREAGIFYLTTR